MPATDDEASGACQRPGEAIDLHTLLGQFLAVRQEVNLQTRAVRAQQEQNAETLRQLAAALDALKQSQTRTEQLQRQTQGEAVRPLLKTLIDLYDALALAGREIERLGETVLPALEQLAAATAEEPADAPAPRSFWASLFGSSCRRRQPRSNGERHNSSAKRRRVRAAARPADARVDVDRLYNELAARRAGAAAARSGSDPNCGDSASTPSGWKWWKPSPTAAGRPAR